MKKFGFFILSLVVVLIISSPLNLQGQSFNLKLGAFYPNMESDLWSANLENLALAKEDMMGLYWGAELELEMNRYFCLALEGGYYNQAVYTAYRDYEHENGSSIKQDLSLRIASLEADFKFYPFGYRNLFNPYIGGGVGIYAWKYVQGGEFINFENNTIYEGEASTRTCTPGFNAKAGFVYRFQRSMGISFEARYNYLKGELSSLFEGFDRLDLSGVTLIVGLNFFLK